MNDNPEKIVELGPHTKMTPEQALAYCMRENWEDVIIVGYKTSGPDLVTRSSAMTREKALWLTEHLRLHVLDLL